MQYIYVQDVNAVIPEKRPLPNTMLVSILLLYVDMLKRVTLTEETLFGYFALKYIHMIHVG